MDPSWMPPSSRDQRRPLRVVKDCVGQGRRLPGRGPLHPHSARGPAHSLCRRELLPLVGRRRAARGQAQ
eukprot:10477491-Lingulodinium_polyedra.AAC.1